jgi:hypothetical protein
LHFGNLAEGGARPIRLNAQSVFLILNTPLYTRISDSTEWINSHYDQPGQSLTINGVSLRVADVYENVVI